MPNLARILINILLYVFYVVTIAFLTWFIIPILALSFGKDIPIYDPEIYNMVFFILAWLIFLITLILRRSCYLSLTSDTQGEKYTSQSYTQKKKTENKKEKYIQDESEDTLHVAQDNEDEIRIYVDKEIK